MTEESTQTSGMPSNGSPASPTVHRPAATVGAVSTVICSRRVSFQTIQVNLTKVEFA